MLPMAVFICVSFLFFFFSVSDASTFTITNSCPQTIWPGTLAGSGTQPLPTTGFKLDAGQSVRIPSTPGWSGRIWARTGCTFDASGTGKCLTGDCGGKLECDGSGATPPASLFEITLGVGNNKDYYDISLVDGYNLPVVVVPTRTDNGGACNATGCVADVNLGCPKELQVVGGDEQQGGVVACKSACEAFGADQYCCSGQFANPTTCKPSFYSAIFKRACPRAYSYAYDDGSSTFTCKASEYAIVFCPNTNRGNRPSGQSMAPPSQNTAPPIQPMNGQAPPNQTQTPNGQSTAPPTQTQTPNGQSMAPPTQTQTPDSQCLAPPTQTQAPNSQFTAPPTQNTAVPTQNQNGQFMAPPIQNTASPTQNNYQNGGIRTGEPMQSSSEILLPVQVWWLLIPTIIGLMHSTVIESLW